MQTEGGRPVRARREADMNALHCKDIDNVRLDGFCIDDRYQRLVG